MKRVANIAHRGASGQAPENTLAAIRAAIAMGSDMVELDLQMSRDGQIVVIHDEDLSRTAGVLGRVGEKNLQELKRLDVGGWYHRSFEGERIPTLGEVLSESHGKVRLDLELKERSAAEGVFEERLIDALNREGMAEEVLISSFHWEMLRNVRKIHPRVEIGLLCRSRDGVFAEAAAFGASTAIYPRRLARKETIRETHEKGLRCYVYTVNDPDEMLRCVKDGVDGICTDFPDRLNTLLRDLLPLC
jgi:glycerophosphoryl diester phosphodiesterase